MFNSYKIVHCQLGSCRETGTLMCAHDRDRKKSESEKSSDKKSSAWKG